MRTKKEIILISIIGVIVIALIILPIIINNSPKPKKDDIVTTNSDNSVQILVYGEITYKEPSSISPDDITNEIKLTAIKGISYGEIINQISAYLTDYSIVDDELTKRYFESSKIYIKSSYISQVEEVDDNIGKININLATIDELSTLYGIGIKRAERIIDYINVNGKIDSFEKLKSLIGVSDEVIELIKEKAFL